ncbi:DUF805 domain-containing protein [Candidatus Trichorickettsia mobilis]|uniref:DUF805 domain-containing protein n=1 Tax=Candidatus Trichorickettsia mobilis TaxID=1346319 RepID=UPI0037420215
MKQAVFLAYSRIFDYSSRASRAEYWWFALFFGIIYGSYSYFRLQENGILVYLLLFFFVTPNLSLSVRRLHDINKSGWWVLIGFIPIVGFMYWHIKPGDVSANRYGATTRLES